MKFCSIFVSCTGFSLLTIPNINNTTNRFCSGNLRIKSDYFFHPRLYFTVFKNSPDASVYSIKNSNLFKHITKFSTRYRTFSFWWQIAPSTTAFFYFDALQFSQFFNTISFALYSVASRIAYRIFSFSVSNFVFVGFSPRRLFSASSLFKAFCPCCFAWYSASVTLFSELFYQPV